MTNLTLARYSILTFVLVFWLQTQPAQNVSSATGAVSQAVEWTRLQSDDGDFSIEMPSNYEFFSEKDGFVTGTDKGEEVEFKNVRILTAYHDKALMAIEAYSLENPKKGLNAISRYVKGRESGVSRDGLKGKQIVSGGEKAFSTALYFATKTNLYVIYTASREENNRTMQRFLNSAKFDSASAAGNVKTIKFSELQVSPFSLTDETKTVANNQNQNAPPNNGKPTDTDVDSKPLIILTQPPPGYTKGARMIMASGEIPLRITFSGSGRVSKIGVLSFLPEGLTRQAVLAALRIKFLPAEKNGQPDSTTKVVEYKFSIY